MIVNVIDYRSVAEDVQRLLAHGVGAGHAGDRDDDARRGARPRQVRPVLAAAGRATRRLRGLRRHHAGRRARGGLHRHASTAQRP